LISVSGAGHAASSGSLKTAGRLPLERNERRSISDIRHSTIGVRELRDTPGVAGPEIAHAPDNEAHSSSHNKHAKGSVGAPVTPVNPVDPAAAPCYGKLLSE
jgi:hypothetical protein